jgi:arsenate reductase-like glutaredoxin family protein
LGPEDLDKVFEGINQVTVARGKKVLTFNMKETETTDEEFRKVVIGPSGNLRAPTAIIGKKALVGFSDDAWDTVFA